MSIRRVERDLNRFRQIVRGKIKKDLRKYMSQGEMIGRQGRKYVSIPLPQIDLPQFRYGSKQGGGVGQGLVDGELAAGEEGEHPAGEFLGFPDGGEAGGGVAGESVGVGLGDVLDEAFGELEGVVDGEVHAFAAGGRDEVGGVAGEARGRELGGP